MGVAEWTLVLTGIGVLIAAIGAAIQYVIRPVVKALRHWRWDKRIQDAWEFTHRVQMCGEMLRKKNLYDRLILERAVCLQGAPANCSYGLVMMDRDIKEWGEKAAEYRKLGDVWFQRLENDDTQQYALEYETGAIFARWNREMSAEFREANKTSIEGLQKKIETPEDVLRHHMSPLLDLSTADKVDEIDPKRHGWVVVKHEDGCEEHFVRDEVVMLSKGVWVGRKVEEGVDNKIDIPECPEHYSGRKWSACVTVDCARGRGEDEREVEVND